MTEYAEKIQVVGVCGAEATVYDLPDGFGFRHFLRRYAFPNYGRALQFAQDYEAGQRRTQPRKPRKEVE